MSFILDALRRAERERNAAQTPELRIVADADGGAHIARPGGPPWPLIAGGAGLALGVIALLVVLLRSPQEQAPEAQTATVAAATPRIVPAGGPVPAHEDEMAMSDPADPQRLDDLVDPESGLNEEPPSPPQYAPRYTTPEPQFTPPAEEQTQQIDPEQPARAMQAEQVELDPSPLPQAKQLKDMPQDYRTDFPKVSLDVHFYDEDPSRRFVMLNGRRYREGDVLPEGPRVSEITEDGVVLNHRGQDVLLPAM